MLAIQNLLSIQTFTWNRHLKLLLIAVLVLLINLTSPLDAGAQDMNYDSPIQGQQNSNTGMMNSNQNTDWSFNPLWLLPLALLPLAFLVFRGRDKEVVKQDENTSAQPSYHNVRKDDSSSDEY